MLRPLALFVILALTLRTFAADHVSDIHRFAITLPDSEPWIKGNVQPLGREAEIVFSFVNMESREGVMVVRIPKFPTNNIMNEAVISRLVEVLKMQGFSVISHGPRQVERIEFLEFISRRTDQNSGNMIAVSRATLREGTVLIATFFGKGEEDLALDVRFLRILDTFRLLGEQKAISSPLTDPMHGYYRVSYIACLAAAGVLTLLFVFVLFRTRRAAFS
jgi:hypothetical protein